MVGDEAGRTMQPDRHPVTVVLGGRSGDEEADKVRKGNVGQRSILMVRLYFWNVFASLEGLWVQQKTISERQIALRNREKLAYCGFH